MENEKYTSQFKALGLEVKALPFYYTPENYARYLMKDVPKKSAISYSDRTDYAGEKKDGGKSVASGLK